jgi:ribosomal-protein-alanine N-acetyltransferase
LLEGKLVNLRKVEKEDVDFYFACFNQMDFWGEYSHPVIEQVPKWFLTQLIDNYPNDFQKALMDNPFIIQKKDGTKIGLMFQFTNQPYGTLEFSCFLVPSERGKGYGAEATQLMVDYLFLSKNIVRIQTGTNVRNKAAQKTLKKVGFHIEGTMRKSQLVRGVWNDSYLLSILREEWKEPKILTKTALK